MVRIYEKIFNAIYFLEDTLDSYNEPSTQNLGGILASQHTNTDA